MDIPLYDTFIQKFLRETIVEQSFIYIDKWSFVHFLSGVILGALIKKFYKGKHIWLIALVILALYEFVEIFLTGILFVSESSIDTVWDLIIGMAGAFIGHKNKK